MGESHASRRAAVGAALAVLLGLSVPQTASAAPGNHGDDIRRISTAADGTQADGASGAASVTPNGRFVAFRSSATNLFPRDTNGVPDVFVGRIH
ncbi:hypothetical protein [Streptomyces sp. NPDC051576]|uniref:hypothetical protein n=1 Tax=Streptomyces sp. NPDC051576 TaxID=3155803 RepID=UPI0034395B49